MQKTFPECLVPQSFYAVIPLLYKILITLEGKIAQDRSDIKCMKSQIGIYVVNALWSYIIKTNPWK